MDTLKALKNIGPHSIMTEEVIPKEEFEFKPLVQFQRPLKLIQRLSILLSLFSVYQLAYSGISVSYFPSSLNIIMSFTGLFSLVMSVFLFIWSNRALKVERNRTLLTQDMIDKALEKISRRLFLSTICRVAVSGMLIPNIIAQGNYTSQHMLATYDMPEYSTPAAMLGNLLLPLPFFEIFTCMTSIYASWVCFRYIQTPGQLVNKIVSFGNLALMGTSLTLIYNIISAEQYKEHPIMSKLLSEGTLTGLAVAGALLAGLTGFVWLFNSRKWRFPTLVVTALIGVTVLGLGGLTVSSYNNANTISDFYQDTSDMNTFTFKMLNVHKNDLEAFGCPAKYLPYEQCQSSPIVVQWEQLENGDNRPMKCLNTGCSDLLGGLYSSPLLEVSNWSMATMLSALLVIAGSLYLCKTSYIETGVRSKKDYGWLGALVAMVVVFSVVISVSSGPYIQERGLTLNDQLQGKNTDIVTRNEELDRWFGGSGVQMEADLSKKISNLFLFKENRYVRMRLNRDYDRILFTEAGDYSQQYQDLVDSLNPYKAELVLVKLPLDTRHDALVGIVWLPSPISPTEKETYLKYYAVDSQDARSEKLGFPVYVATNKDDLAKDVVLYNVFKSRSVFLEDELLEVNQQDLILQRQEMMTFLAAGANLPLDVSPQDAAELFQMVVSKSNKFLVIGFDLANNKASIEGRGDWQSSYDDFVGYFQPGEAKIGLIYLDVEGVSRLVYVVQISEQLIQKAQDVENDGSVPDVSNIDIPGFFVYIITDPEQLRLDPLMTGISATGRGQQEAAKFVQMPAAMKLWSLPEKTMREKFQLNLVTVAGSDIGMQIFNMVADQNLKFLLQRYNTDEKKVEQVGKGDWETSNYTTFINMINPREAQVGYIYLQLEKDKNLVLFIYAPEDKYQDPKEVFKLFGLPSDPRRLESIGIHTYIARNTSAFGLEDVLKSIYGEKERIATLLAEIDGLETDGYYADDDYSNYNNYGDSAATEEDDGLIYSDIRLRMLAADDLADNEFIKAMQQKDNKWMILQLDPTTNKTLISKTGGWDTTFNDMANQLNRGIAQIGLASVKLETITKQILVVYIPSAVQKSVAQVLTEFGFPADIGQLKKKGISLFSGQTKSDITLKNVLRNIYTDVPAVLDMLQFLIESDDENDYDVSAFCATCGGNSGPARTAPYPGDRTVPNGLDTEQMNEIVRNTDQYRTKMVDTEQMTEIIRDRDEYQSNMVDTEQMTEIIRDRDEATLNAFSLFGFGGKMGLKLSRDIVKPLKAKKVKYIILRQDPAINNNKTYIASNGTWFATFDQFVREFEPLVPQVGFIYLEIEGQEKLVMVVYAPATLGVDAKQVVKDFKVTKKDAAKLKKKGIFTYVINDLQNLTLDSAINSVYSQENEPIIKLMTLMETYESQLSMMYELNLDEIASDRENAQMMMLFGFGHKGLKMSREARKIALNTESKYAIVLVNTTSGDTTVVRQSTWHSTFDQFAKDFDPVQDQVGFIWLEIEQEQKLVMVFYAPNNASKTDDEIFKDFNVAKSVKKLEKHDISVYFARSIGDITLDKVINKVFNTRNPNASIVTTATTQNFGALTLPADITDALQNQKYKYVVLKHDPKQDVTTIETTGAWGNDYKKFLKDFSSKKDQIAIINLEIEAKTYPTLVVWSNKNPPSQVLRNFGLPGDEAAIRAAGVDVVVAYKKKDLEILTLLQGVYSEDTFTSTGPKFMMAYTETDLPLGKDVVDALTNKKYKYMVLKHDIKTDTTTVDSLGGWNNSTSKDFFKAFSKKQNQIGFIFLEAEAKTILTLVVYAPKVAGTQVLREFGITSDPNALNDLGIKTYIAHKKKELDVEKILQAVYNADTFGKTNPVMFLGTDDAADDSEYMEEDSDFLDDSLPSAVAV